MAFDVGEISRIEALAFSIFRTDNGKLILDYLRRNYRLDMPAYSPSLPVENAVWRDGARSVVDQIQWITDNLEIIVQAKHLQEQDDGIIVDRQYG